MSEQTTGLKDFDSILRPERKARLHGEIIDVTKIPSRVTLEMARLSDNQKELNSEQGFFKSVELVARACKPSNDKITAHWLLDNTDFETLMDFMDYVLEPVKKRTEQAEADLVKNITARANKTQKK